MLVIYDITLSPEVRLPAELSLRIPAAAGKPHAVAAYQPDLTNLNYEQQASGEWLRISFTATTPQLRLEYYDPNLIKEQSSRSFEYQWPGDYAVDSMVIRVQQPSGASDLAISPNMSGDRTTFEGLVYYTYNFGSLPEGQPFNISVNYQKTNDELTVSSQPIQPSAPIDEATAGRTTTLMSVLPWILGSLGLLLIVGGGVWYWQSSREKARPMPGRRRRSSGRQDEALSEEGHIYCHECGKRAGPSDRFCRTCGTQLRSG
jgi:hypothetical protein